MRSKYEIETQKRLEKDGWFCDYKARPRWNPRGYNVDYWNLFDILAWKPGRIKMISVKPAKNVSTLHQRQIKEFEVPQGIEKEIWKFDRNPKDRRYIRCRVLKLDTGKGQM